jgi:Gram-negative bacterial TonB protein C-terminal
LLVPLEREIPAMICRMPKLLSSIFVLLCVVGFVNCFDARGQGSRPRSENNRREDRTPVVFLDSTKEIDGLKGPVRRVETEIVRVHLKRGKLVQQSRSLLERTLYDERGQRIENETYPIVGTRVGQETHKYDAQGNLSETVVRDEHGTVLSKTVYDYKLDGFGNWVQMTASLVVSNSGKVEYEPTEITRRTITYYLTDEQDAPKAATSAAREKATVAPVAAEGDKVSRRVESSDAKQPQVVLKPQVSLQNSLAAESLLNAGVLNTRTTALPKPAFPVNGKRLDEPVTVAVEVVVDITGRVVEAHAGSGPEALREASERAARRASFLPFYVAGRPVRARGLINYTFDYLP